MVVGKTESSVVRFTYNHTGDILSYAKYFWNIRQKVFKSCVFSLFMKHIPFSGSHFTWNTSLFGVLPYMRHISLCIFTSHEIHLSAEFHFLWNTYLYIFTAHETFPIAYFYFTWNTSHYGVLTSHETLLIYIFTSYDTNCVKYFHLL